MRISALLFAVLVVAMILGIARDEVGRIAVIVFFTGIGVTGSGVTAVMALFQTIGAFGEARSLMAHVEALAATVVVLIVGPAVMVGILLGGSLLVKWAIP